MEDCSCQARWRSSYRGVSRSMTRLYISLDYLLYIVEELSDGSGNTIDPET